MIIVRKSEQSNSAHPLGPRGFLALEAALIRAHSQRFCRAKEILTFVSKSFLSSADNATNVKSTALSLRCRRGSAKLFSPVSQLLLSSLLPPNFAFTETVGFSHRLGGACSRAATSLCVTELFACTGALRFLLPFTREQSDDLTIAR